MIYKEPTRTRQLRRVQEATQFVPSQVDIRDAVMILETVSSTRLAKVGKWQLQTDVRTLLACNVPASCHTAQDMSFQKAKLHMKGMRVVHITLETLSSMAQLAAQQ